MATNTHLLDYHYDNCEQTKDIFSNQAQASHFLDASLDRKVLNLRESVERNADWGKDATNSTARQIVDDITKSTDHVVGDIGRATTQVVTDIHNGTMAGLIATNKGASESILATERANNLYLRESGLNQAALTNMIERNNAATIQSATGSLVGLERNRADIKYSILESENRANNASHSNVVENMKEHCKINESIFNSGKNIQLQAAEYQAKNDSNFCKVDSDLSKLASKHFEKTNYRNLEASHRLEKQIADSARISQLDICKLENTLSSQANVNTTAIQIEALKNKCHIEKQLEECCCELKRLMAANACAVQNQITSSDNSRLREQLEEAKTRALVLSLQSNGRGNGNGNGNGGS